MKTDRQSDIKVGKDGKHQGGAHCKVTIFFILLVLFVSLSLGAGGVFAAQTNESAGPGSTGGAGGYGWQQVFTGTAGGSWARLTGSADRMNYSYGYKNIQIYTREEDYWSEDCGWWYVGGGNTTGIKIVDAAGDTVATSYSQTPTQGRNVYTYNWSTDDDPGRWTVNTNDSMGNLAVFYLYVKGQLNVSAVNGSASPTAGNSVTIYGTLVDNAGNAVNGSATDNTGTSVAPTVKAYISGAGETFVVTLTDGNNDGIWTGSFTPQNMGDHLVTVKAGDGNAYWVDGRGSAFISVSGDFPAASLGLSALLRTFGNMAGNFDFSALTAALAGLTGLAVFKRRGAA